MGSFPAGWSIPGGLLSYAASWQKAAVQGGVAEIEEVTTAGE